MLQVTKLWARSFNLEHEDVFWEIAPVLSGSADLDNHEIFNFDFYVLRSDAALGPYEEIGGPFRDVYHFRDVKVSLLTKYRQYFYKLKIVDRRTQETTEFGPSATHDAEPDIVAAAIIHEEDVLFRKFVGRRCWLYPVRTFGPKCSCFDTTMQRQTRSSHLPCFGTGWLGGYMSPVEVFVQFDPSPKVSMPLPTGEIQPVMARARMSSFPPVSVRDILIESENTRWRVVNVETTQRLRAVVHQEMSLIAVPRSDVEYAIPLHVDAKTVAPADEANFTNPQNVESDGDLHEILAFWTGKPRGALR